MVRPDEPIWVNVPLLCFSHSAAVEAESGDWGQNSWELLGWGGVLLEQGLFWILDNSCKLAWSWTIELKHVLMCLGTWGQIHWLHLFLASQNVFGIKLCWGGKSRQKELETKDCQKDRY